VAIGSGGSGGSGAFGGLAARRASGRGGEVANGGVRQETGGTGLARAAGRRADVAGREETARVFGGVFEL
jgi:hypothetical protein